MLLAVGGVPTSVRSNAERCHWIAVRRVTHLGIAADVPDYDHLVHRHGCLPPSFRLRKPAAPSEEASASDRRVRPRPAAWEEASAPSEGASAPTAGSLGPQPGERAQPCRRPGGRARSRPQPEEASAASSGSSLGLGNSCRVTRYLTMSSDAVSAPVQLGDAAGIRV